MENQDSSPRSGLARGPAVAGSSSPGGRLISNALVNYSGLIVGAVVGVLLVPLMLGRLGTSQYGLWVVAVTLAASLRAIDFGLGLVVMREVAAAAGTRRFRRTTPLVSAAGGAHLMLGLAGAVLLACAALVFKEPLRLPPGSEALVLPVFSLVGLALVGEQAIAFASAVLAGLHRFGTVNGIGIALVLLRAAGTVALLLLGASLLPVALWHAGSTVAVAVIAVAMLRARPGRYGIGHFGRHWHSLRSHLPFGVASFASATLAGLVWQALPLLTAVLLGAGAVVSVHVGQKIPLVLTSIYGRLATVVFPAASEYHRTANVAGGRTVLKTGTRLVIHLMIPVVVVGILAAPDLLRLWLGEANPLVVLVFRLTLVAVLADALGSVAVNVIWGQGRVTPILVASSAGAVIIAAGSALVLPAFGVGAGVVVLAGVLVLVSTAFWRMACASTAVRPDAFTFETVRGIGVPALSCGSVALAVGVIPGLSTPLRIIMMGVAAAIAYFWLLARIGSTPEEREFVDRARHLPRELLLPIGRTVGTRCPSLRSLGYLVLSLRAIVRHPTSRSVQEFDHEFEASRDPWGYGRAQQQERITLALQEVTRLAAERPGDAIESALEIGCAEGTVTELLAPCCRRLVAVDLSSVALARCEDRCRHLAGIEYRQSDAVGAAVWGPYDLVVAMDVLECIRSPSALRRARDAIAEMLRPGGHLVVTTTRQHPVPESAWWGRWLPIGARINEFVGRHVGLERIRHLRTATHAISVYRRIE